METVYRERERERQRERQRETERETERQRDYYGHNRKETYRLTDQKTQKNEHVPSGRRIDIQTDCREN